MALTFLKRSPMQKLEDELASLRKRAAKLDSKRAAAKTDLDRAIAAREAHMLGGDLDDDRVGTKLQAAVDTALSTLAAFGEAITKQAALISDVEHKVAAERDRADRKVAAEALQAQITAIEEMLPAWLQITRNLAEGFEGTGHFRPECAQIAAFLRNAASEIQGAATVTFDDLHRWVTTVRDGNGPIPRAPAAPAPAKLAIVAPPQPTLAVFMLKSVKYVDANGAIVVCAKHRLHDLPQALGEMALANNMALPLSERQKIRDLEYNATPYAPDPATAAWLGTPAAAKPAAPKSGVDPILSSHFEPQRPPQTVRISVEPTETVRTGTRSQPPEEE